MGDAKLAVVLGMYTGFLGWGVFAVALVLSFVLGGLVSIWLLITKRAATTRRIAFGPFLIMGTGLALAFS